MVMYIQEKYAELNVKIIIVIYVQGMVLHVPNAFQDENYIMANAP